MESLLLVLVLVGLLIVVLLSRMLRLERRISALERHVASTSEADTAAPSTPATAPQPPPLPPVRTPVASAAASAIAAVSVAAPNADTPPRATAPTAAPAPRVSTMERLDQRLRSALAGQEWEAIVGGSLLNKAGVLVLVVGIALFIGYGLTELGPAGRVAIGLAIAVALLALGALAERRRGYLVLGRGLLAGGWAVLYFTTYALWALPAARIVEAPVLGFVLLLGVAAGMVAHAARYRREWVMVLAYAVAYATLLLGPAGSQLATVATYPLTISLVAIALRRQWAPLGLAGLLFTYGVYFTQLLQAAPERITWQMLFVALLFLALYWAIFEVADLLALRRGRHRHSSASSLAPLNHALWLGSSAVIWANAYPVEMPWLSPGGGLAVVAVLLLASAFVRERVLAPSAARGPGGWDSHLVDGGYEPAMILAAAAAAGWALMRFEGVVLLLVLLLEGEALWLAGWLLRRQFLARVGSVLLGLAVVRAGWELYGGAPLEWWGLPATTFVPHGLAVLATSMFNRWRLRSQAAAFPQEPVAWAVLATVMVALLAWRILPPTLVAGAWGLQALVWFEWGHRAGSPQLRKMGHALALTTFGRVLLANLTSVGFTGAVSHRVLLVAPLVMLFYYLAAQTARRTPAAPWSSAERTGGDTARWEADLGLWHLYAAGILTSLLLRFELGRVAVVAGWALQGLALLYAARRLGHRHLLLQANLLALLVFARAWATNFDFATEYAGLFGRMGTGVIVIACFFSAYFIARPPSLPDAAGVPGSHALDLRRMWRLTEEYARAGYVLLGAALLALLSYYEVSGHLLTIAWGLESMCLLAAGFALRQRLWRLAGLLLFLAALAKLFFHDLRELETPWRILSFIALGAMMLAVSWAYARFRERLRELL
jgi:hypothetical protein